MPSNKNVIFAPPPWTLKGNAYIIVFKLPRHFIERHCFVPVSLIGRFHGGFGTVMFVDYQRSDVGPYQELLFIPGRFNFQGKKLYSITKIYVSTWDSVINGQNNWGLPKEIAKFNMQHGRKTTEHISVWRGNQVIADLTFRFYPFSLPLTSTIIPKAWRTLAQPYRGKTFLTTLATQGTVQLARIVDTSIDGAFFPDFTRAHIVATVKLTDFSLNFPKPNFLL